METWDEMIRAEFKVNEEDYTKMVTTLTYAELHEKFDTGYGGTHGKPFTAWGDKFVYFPVVYDGAEWVGSAPRNPCDIKTDHVGGG